MYKFPEELRKSYEMLAMPLAFYERGEGGKLIPLLVSDGFCEMMELDRGKLVRHLEGSTFEKVHSDDIGKVISAGTAFINGAPNYDIIYRSKYKLSDEYHYVHSKGVRQIMPDGTELMMVVYLDLSACVDETSKLLSEYKFFQEDRFYTDALTGLPNINYMNQIGDEWVNTLRIHGKTPLMIYMDVIGMQSYNNKYGYQGGNELLCLATKILREVFPKGLLVRGPDDHFLLIDEYVSLKETETRIETVDVRVQQEAAGNTPGIKAGVRIFESNMSTVSAADDARKALRWLGDDLNRVCLFHSVEAEKKLRNERYVIENFETALREGWIKVFYQGITRTATGKGAAAESLARWVDPERGLLSPVDFIPALEKYHLLHKLDLYMAENACRDLLRRKERGFQLLPVTVNFSAQDFEYADIPEELNKLYIKYCPDLSLKDRYLIVEITEQDMATATDKFQEQLGRLKKMGFRLWLDDFGSGYSSLNVFSSFDVDLIKFDMELLKNLDGHNGANRRIMKAMVEICKELGIQTLAEGMETEGQRLFLKEIGCDLAQGFLFHKPEPLDATFDRINAGENLMPRETPEERDRLLRQWYGDKRS